MDDDIEELLKMLVAASHDERLSTGALYSRAAATIEGQFRELRAYRKDGWQPIETAPMDGKFLVWADHGLPWPASASDGVIRSNAHGSVNNPKDRYSLTATHWMPIPAAPEPQDTENGNVE